MFRLKSATTEKQLSDIEKLGLQELDLTKNKRAKVAELARAEPAAGEDYLDGSGDAAVADVQRLQTEIAAMDRAIALLRERRPAILRREFVTEAQEVRRQADDRAGRLRALTERTSALLANLAQLEGCQFEPAGTPKSSLLQAEIAELQRKAVALDEKRVPADGEVDLLAVTSADEVVQAVVTHASLSPAIEQVLTWLDGCEAAAVKYRGARSENHPRRASRSPGTRRVSRATRTFSVASWRRNGRGIFRTRKKRWTLPPQPSDQGACRERRVTYPALTSRVHGRATRPASV